jgi:predicted enzyme related to lactoylglutathione lyase
VSASGHPAASAHGQVGYLQLPARDVAHSAAFYAAVFGWTGELEHGSFSAPGLIGQWSTELTVASGAGPILWIAVDDLWKALREVASNGGAVHTRPRLDQGARWLVEVDDPAGNRIGLVAVARTARSQTLLAVRDVEASSRWYQRLLGLTSDHGGPDYERLLADDVLVLQLHHRAVGHDHGTIDQDVRAPAGNGALIWFGEVSDFDGVVERAAEMGVTVVRPPHRNPPDAEMNGPSHREIWIRDPDGYTVVIASPDGEAWTHPELMG